MHEQFVVLQKSNNTSKQRALLFIWYTRYLFFHIFNSVNQAPTVCWILFGTTYAKTDRWSQNLHQKNKIK